MISGFRVGGCRFDCSQSFPVYVIAVRLSLPQRTQASTNRARATVKAGLPRHRLSNTPPYAQSRIKRMRARPQTGTRARAAYAACCWGAAGGLLADAANAANAGAMASDPTRASPQATHRRPLQALPCCPKKKAHRVSRVLLGGRRRTRPNAGAISRPGGPPPAFAPQPPPGATAPLPRTKPKGAPRTRHTAGGRRRPAAARSTPRTVVAGSVVSPPPPRPPP